MKKNYLILILFSIFISHVGFSQGMEDFSSTTTLPESTYGNGSFTGNDGIVWNYVHARNQDNYPIDGNGMILRRADEPSSLSATISGGIGDFSVDTRKAFTGNTQRKLELVINGTVVQQFQPPFADGADDMIYTFTVEDINVEGDFLLELRMYGANGNQQIVLDNITWTGYPEDGCQIPTLTTTTPNEVCEGENATLSATSDGFIYWFASETDENILGSGATFQTEELSTTTSFWAEARSSETETGGARASTSATSNSSVVSATSPWGLSFDAYEDFHLHSVDVYLASSSPGDITIQLKDDTYTLLEQITVSLPAGNSSTPVQHTVSVNFTIPQGTGYKLVASSSPSMVREFSSAHPGFPYPIGDVGSVTAGTINNSTSNNTLYYFFYNWSVTPLPYCASDREEVVVTVSPVAAVEVEANENNVCPDSEVILTASSTNTNYEYTWASEGMDGASITVSPEETTTYTVTATDISTNCSTQEEVTVVVYDNSQDEVSITSTATTVCAGSSLALTAEVNGSSTAVTWYPGDYLYEDAEATIPYSNGLLATVYFNSEGGVEMPYSALHEGTCMYFSGEIVVSSTFVEPPTAETTQQMDEGDLVSDLEVQGENLTWYADADGTTIIEDSSVLEEGVTYFVSQNINGCESELLAITVDSTQGISHIDFQNLTFYPNPTSGALNISNATYMVNVEVYNLLGQKLHSEKVGGTEIQLDLSHLSEGTYLIKINTENAVQILQIIRE